MEQRGHDNLRRQINTTNWTYGWKADLVYSFTSDPHGGDLLGTFVGACLAGARDSQLPDAAIEGREVTCPKSAHNDVGKTVRRNQPFLPSCSTVNPSCNASCTHEYGHGRACGATRICMTNSNQNSYITLFPTRQNICQPKPTTVQLTILSAR